MILAINTWTTPNTYSPCRRVACHPKKYIKIVAKSIASLLSTSFTFIPTCLHINGHAHMPLFLLLQFVIKTLIESYLYCIRVQTNRLWCYWLWFCHPPIRLCSCPTISHLIRWCLNVLPKVVVDFDVCSLIATLRCLQISKINWR